MSDTPVSENKYPLLFSPLVSGRLRLRNRILHASMTTRRVVDQRVTPGMEATASVRFCPSITNTGQIRSWAVSVFSRTSARDQAVRRLRRMRRAGKVEAAEGRCVIPDH